MSGIEELELSEIPQPTHEDYFYEDSEEDQIEKQSSLSQQQHYHQKQLNQQYQLGQLQSPSQQDYPIMRPRDLSDSSRHTHYQNNKNRQPGGLSTSSNNREGSSTASSKRARKPIFGTESSAENRKISPASIGQQNNQTNSFFGQKGNISIRGSQQYNSNGGVNNNFLGQNQLQSITDQGSAESFHTCIDHTQTAFMNQHTQSAASIYLPPSIAHKDQRIIERQSRYQDSYRAHSLEDNSSHLPKSSSNSRIEINSNNSNNYNIAQHNLNRNFSNNKENNHHNNKDKTKSQQQELLEGSEQMILIGKSSRTSSQNSNENNQQNNTNNNQLPIRSPLQSPYLKQLGKSTSNIKQFRASDSFATVRSQQSGIGQEINNWNQSGNMSNQYSQQQQQQAFQMQSNQLLQGQLQGVAGGLGHSKQHSLLGSMSSPKKNLQPAVQIDNQQMMELKAEMMRSAKEYFEVLKNNIIENQKEVAIIQKAVVLKQDSAENPTIDKKIELEVARLAKERINKRLGESKREHDEVIRNIKATVDDAKMRMEEELQAVQLSRRNGQHNINNNRNEGEEARLDQVKFELEAQIRYQVENMHGRCNQIEDRINDKRGELRIQKIVADRERQSQVRLQRLELELTAVRSNLQDKMATIDVGAQLRELVAARAKELQEDLKDTQNQYSREAKIKETKTNQISSHLSKLKISLNEQLSDLSDRVSELTKKQSAMESQNDQENRVLRCRQDLKALQSWYLRLTDQFQAVRDAETNNHMLSQQIQRVSVQVESIQQTQQQLHSEGQIKYKSPELTDAQMNLQKIARNLHEIDEYKKQKLGLLERKLEAATNLANQKIQALIMSNKITVKIKRQSIGNTNRVSNNNNSGQMNEQQQQQQYQFKLSSASDRITFGDNKKQNLQQPSSNFSNSAESSPINRITKDKKSQDNNLPGNNTTNSQNTQLGNEGLKAREYFAVSYGGDEGASSDCLNPLENKLHNGKRLDDGQNNNDVQNAVKQQTIIQRQTEKNAGNLLGLGRDTENNNYRDSDPINFNEVDCISKDRFSNSPRHSAASSSAQKKSNVSKEFILFPDKPIIQSKHLSNQSLESYKLSSMHTPLLSLPSGGQYSQPTGYLNQQSYKHNTSQQNLIQLHTEEQQQQSQDQETIYGTPVGSLNGSAFEEDKSLRVITQLQEFNKRDNNQKQQLFASKQQYKHIDDNNTSNNKNNNNSSNHSNLEALLDQFEDFHEENYLVSERIESEGDYDEIDSDGLQEISHSSNNTAKNGKRLNLKDTDEDENEFVICSGSGNTHGNIRQREQNSYNYQQQQKHKNNHSKMIDEPLTHHSIEIIPPLEPEQIEEATYSKDNNNRNYQYEQPIAQQPQTTYQNIQPSHIKTSTLLNQIKEEDAEQEDSHHLSLQSSSSTIDKGNNKSVLPAYTDTLRAAKAPSSMYKLVDQITKLLELRSEKKLRCRRDQLGYLKDASGFFVFDTKGSMIKADAQALGFLQAQGYVQLL